MDDIEAKFGDACSRLSEFFDDYLLLVKVPGGGFISRASDHCWAFGAAARYISNIKSDDAIDLKEFRNKREKQ